MAKKVLVWGIVHYVAVGDPPKTNWDKTTTETIKFKPKFRNAN